MPPTPRKAMCDCGFPQSSPIPHAHSLPERKAIYSLLPWKVFNQESCSIIVNKKRNCIATKLNESDAALNKPPEGTK